MGSAAGEGEAPSYDIAVLKGDGVGPDVVDEAVRVLEAAVNTGGTHLKFSEYPCGTDCYLEQGTPLADDTLAACRRADAVLLGATADPEVRWPDGTEMRPQVDLRFKLDLYDGLRPIYYSTLRTTLRCRAWKPATSTW